MQAVSIQRGSVDVGASSSARTSPARSQPDENAFQKLLGDAMKAEAPLTGTSQGTQQSGGEAQSGAAEAGDRQPNAQAAQKPKKPDAQSRQEQPAQDSDQQTVQAAAVLQQNAAQIQVLLGAQLEEEIVNPLTTAAQAIEAVAEMPQQTQAQQPQAASEQARQNTPVQRQEAPVFTERPLVNPQEAVIVSVEMAKPLPDNIHKYSDPAPPVTHYDVQTQIGDKNTNPQQVKFDAMVQQASQAIESRNAGEYTGSFTIDGMPVISIAPPKQGPAAVITPIGGISVQGGGTEETGKIIPFKPPTGAAGKAADAAEELVALELSGGISSAVPVQARPVETPQQEQYTPARQVQTQIVEHLQKGKMEFRMQLQPEDLGKIDVRMVLESGRLSVEISAAAAKTSELLSRQAEGLAASLRMQGIELQSVQVVPANESEAGHMEQSLSMMYNQDRQDEQQGDSERSAARSAQSSQEIQANEDTLPKGMMNYTI